MADRLITPEQAAAHVQQHCPDPVDITTYGERPGAELICGCGHCPEPDPTPEQYRRRVEDAIWRATAGERDYRWIETEMVRG